MPNSIPKDELDAVVAHYHCTKEEAAKAYRVAQEKARTLFRTSLDEILGSAPAAGKSEIKIRTPREIKAHLDKYVIGQEEYKKRICIAASYHFGIVQYLREHPHAKDINRFRKKNTIIAGPSGSGKTYCAEVLGDLLDVPTLIIDATDYTEVGYVGKNSDDMVRELIDLAPGENRAEQLEFISNNGGIIFIDEIDKKAKDGAIVGHDISREGFQRSVLKLIERKLVPVENPYSAMSQLQEAMARKEGKSAQKDKLISTENILFVLGGSFERSMNNLESIIRKRVAHGGRLTEDGSIVVEGFHPDERERKQDKYKNYYQEADADDYIRFGLLPELVGRAPIRSFVNLLSKNDLIRIMTDTEDSILSQYAVEFKLFGIDLEITPEAIEYVADLGQNKKTGARALVSVWESILTDFQFELPGTNFTKLVVDRSLCERPKDELLRLLQRSPFVDFTERFKREFGIDLILDDDIQRYIEEVARRENSELAAIVKNRLSGASALNYMNHKGPYRITREMIDDPKYFDKLFTEWHEKQLRKQEG